MSKLDELIQELCPNGVEYKALKDVLTIKNGGFENGKTNLENKRNNE